MPDDYSSNNAALAASAAQAINSASSYMAASSLNSKTRAFTREMYDRQRADALVDWQLQNNYNSPKAQMQRLREAGLNPNLVYGNGAQMSSATINSKSAQSWSPEVPSANFGSPITAYQDARVQQAQLDNLTAQNTLIHNQSMQVLAETLNTGITTDTKSFDLKMKQALEEMTMAQAQTNYEYTTQKKDEVYYRNLVNGLGSVQNAKVSEILNRAAQREFDLKKISPEKLNLIKKQIDIMEKTGKLRDFDIMLQSGGVDKNAPWFIKLFATLVKRLTGM